MTQQALSHGGGAANTRVDLFASDANSRAVPSDASDTLLGVCSTLRRKIESFLNDVAGDEVLCRTREQTRVAMAVIDDALRRYQPEELSLSYNGGKDCLVLLILIMACLPSTTSTTASEIKGNESNGNGPNGTAHGLAPALRPIQALYIAPSDPFPEVEDFVATSSKEYHLDLTRYSLPMRAALEAYQRDRTPVKAIFMGTRRTDPHSEFLEHFSMTDPSWPQYMRINPMLDWHYADIWAFIRRLDIPFCVLYDRGFSSLGGVNNTRPNPALAIDAEGKTFLPAYELKRDDEERLGRDK